ncbi:MAG TPA: hypothetical protein VMB50_05390, partial [Myxococcales bacterium]|nr:hypothetical protein [Myxococcales bacterium]
MGRSARGAAAGGAPYFCVDVAGGTPNGSAAGGADSNCIVPPGPGPSGGKSARMVGEEAIPALGRAIAGSPGELVRTELAAGIAGAVRAGPTAGMPGELVRTGAAAGALAWTGAGAAG